MLARLMKYDIKAAAKTFLPFYAVLLIMAVINRFSAPFDDHVTLLSGLAAFGYAIALITVLVVTIIVIIQRFYRSIVKDEAYLMFTLPVSTWQLIASKAIVSLIWSIASLITIVG